MAKGPELIRKYFPELSDEQSKLLMRAADLYMDWNSKVNVISRKDMDYFFERHVLHSMSILKIAKLKGRVMDLGSGGGLPGIPLAIMLPDVQFVLVDSIGKKCKVMRDIAKELGLKNVSVINDRAEDVEGEFDIVVCRAVAPLRTILHWVGNKVKKGGKMYCLKGGDLSEEIKEAKVQAKTYNISELFEEEFFEMKKVVEVKK